MSGLGIWGLLWAVVALVDPAEPTALVEAARPGDTSRVTIELKADGTFRPATPPGAPEAKSMALQVATQLEFTERVIAVGAGGVPARSVRSVVKAGATIGGEVRPSTSAVRPEVSALAATRRAETAVDVVSLGGPLTRSELELVSGPGDPLALPALLPAQPVRPGDHWTIGELAARNLSGYDALVANSLEATLDALDDSTARVRLLGTIRGAALGGEGSMACDGSFRFDRKTGQITELSLRRAETRRPGPVESGLDVKSVLTVTRTSIPAGDAPGLDDSVASLARNDPAARDRRLLLFQSPAGKYTLLHDRDWHLYWDDSRQVVFKRLDHGEMIAQCNLTVGPDAGAGRHQDLNQFRADLRKGLGSRFVRIVQEGEVEGAALGGFRHKVTVEGRQGDAGVLWHYYLIASPAGDQLIATFTLGMAQQIQFAANDLEMIGTLEWK